MVIPNPSFPTSVSFRVSPRTVRMLGRENISSPVIGVLELVKNAYDADATHVTVRFQRPSTGGRRIVVEDNGEGMGLSDLLDKWMVISTDNKLRRQISGKGRVKVGEKGIGRLAMDRLCNTAVIVTHRQDSNGIALRLELDWTKYEEEQGELHDVKHPLSQVQVPEGRPSGTRIELQNLRDEWTREDYARLLGDLALLVPPFDQDLQDFSICFECDEVPELSGPIGSPMVAAAEYKLESRLTEAGSIRHTLTHRSGAVEEDELPWYRAFDAKPGAGPSCGPMQFILYFYLREASSLKDTDIRLRQLVTYLRSFQGVRIYRDHFRVKPYGDPSGDRDWLGLNLRKVRQPAAISRPEWVLAENQVVGSIFISRQNNPDLQDQTNREGLVENSAYRDMRAFALHGIRFLEHTRYRRSLVERDATRHRPLPPINEMLGDSEKELRALATELRETSAKIPAAPGMDRSDTGSLGRLADRIEQVSAQVQRTQATYVDEQTERQLLLGLATIGVAMAAFGHETIRAVDSVLNRVELLKEDLESLPNEELTTRALEDLAVLEEAADQVRHWGKYALDRVSRQKRTQRSIDLNELVEHVLEIFAGRIDSGDIQVDKNLASNLPLVRAFPMDIEAILINFVTNAVEAMRFTRDKRIRITTSYDASSHTVVLGFSDNGRGIRAEDVSRVFDPLFSTKQDPNGQPIGTGMGLAIVKDIVHNYRGRIDVEGQSSFGGAEFRVYLPDRSVKGREDG
jgi:signal transduction histidine kinase